MEECGELVKWDELRPVVEVDVAGAFDEVEFLRLGGFFVGGLAEAEGDGFTACNEEQRARGDGLDALEGVKVQKLACFKIA